MLQPRDHSTVVRHLFQEFRILERAVQSPLRSYGILGGGTATRRRSRLNDSTGGKPARNQHLETVELAGRYSRSRFIRSCVHARVGQLFPTPYFAATTSSCLDGCFALRRLVELVSVSSFLEVRVNHFDVRILHCGWLRTASRNATPNSDAFD